MPPAYFQWSQPGLMHYSYKKEAMKKETLFNSTLILLLCLATPACFSKRSFVSELEKQEKKKDEELSAREEVQKSFPLSKESKVEIRSVNGKLDVGVSTTGNVEVKLVRRAKAAELFKDRKYVFEQKGDTLSLVAVTRGDGNDGPWGALSESRMMLVEMTVLIPAGTRVALAQINGETKMSGIGGALELRNINGQTRIADVGASLEASNITGETGIDFLSKANAKINMRSINGETTLRFQPPVNLEVEVRNYDGQVDVQLPDLKVTDNKNSHYLAKAGSGGGRVDIHALDGILKIQTLEGKAAAK